MHRRRQHIKKTQQDRNLNESERLNQSIVERALKTAQGPGKSNNKTINSRANNQLDVKQNLQQLNTQDLMFQIKSNEGK